MAPPAKGSIFSFYIMAPVLTFSCKVKYQNCKNSQEKVRYIDYMHHGQYLKYM